MNFIVPPVTFTSLLQRSEKSTLRLRARVPGVCACGAVSNQLYDAALFQRLLLVRAVAEPLQHFGVVLAEPGAEPSRAAGSVRELWNDRRNLHGPAVGQPPRFDHLARSVMRVVHDVLRIVHATRGNVGALERFEYSAQIVLARPALDRRVQLACSGHTSRVRSE